ncbi:hypothetical protein [Reichenbachiella versicolor]|uniref:hypothetical protein n=1 Tax=Reichenbachiella versicolor TaxID=1821036 RepID=UPI000D6DFCD4|nr:hypothetical protein [Reichenbachiella versicolor]
MKRILLYLLIIISLSAFDSKACDICGCKLGGLSYGILPQYDSHFIGLRYSNASFKAEINYNSPYDQDVYSNDTYNRVDLIGRYVVTSKIYLNVIFPYMHNVMRGNEQNISVSGIGDPMMLIYYNPINTGYEMEKRWKHSLLIGGGLKLPLGNYQAVDNGEIINRNFQLGSGSLDYVVSLNYTLRYNLWGVNIESSYKMNTKNKENYQFGNQINYSSYLFYQIETTLASILPYGGFYYEWSDLHKDGIIIQTNTGGKVLFASIGSQIIRSNWSINVQFQIPVNQSYNVDQYSSISAGERTTIGLMYNISSKR